MGSEIKSAVCKDCGRARSREKGLCRPCFRMRYPHFSRPAMPARLADLRTVYQDKLPVKPTTAQANLQKMFADSPAKFMEMFDREERDYRDRVDRAWAESERLNEADRLAKERASLPAEGGETLLPEELIETLIAELLARMKEKA